jgi:hypothetical protein
MKIFALALASISSSLALSPDKCGGALTSDCLCETDTRYCKDFPTSILGQDSRWETFEGYWKATANSYEADGTAKQPAPFNTNTGFGLPYKNDVVVGFYNHTIVDSLLIVDRLFIQQPAPAEFCAGEFGENELNVIDPGECGVTGYAWRGGQYATSTHENDGTYLLCIASK